VGWNSHRALTLLRARFRCSRLVYWYAPTFLCSARLQVKETLTDRHAVAYALGIYLLNLFLAFLQPKFDPSNEAMDNDMEDGAIGTLPTRQDEEFRPFIRRLPEFKFWHAATRAITISFFCSWFEIFNVPVFWPVLVMYWFMLFILTSMFQVPLPDEDKNAMLTV